MHTPAPSGCCLPLTAWHRFLTWCGYTQDYRNLKAELRTVQSTLSPAEVLAMPPLIRGPRLGAPVEQKLAKWTR